MEGGPSNQHIGVPAAMKVIKNEEGRKVSSKAESVPKDAYFAFLLLRHLRIRDMRIKVHELLLWRCFAIYHTLPYSAILYHTLPYSTILYTLPYSTILYHTLPYSTLLYHTLPYSTILHHTPPYSTILYHTLLYHTLPYSTILYHTLPYSTILYHTPTSILYYNLKGLFSVAMVISSVSQYPELLSLCGAHPDHQQ